jgi:hypothetical protein
MVNFKHKCRLCGVIESTPYVLLVEAMAGNIREPRAPEMLATHECADGGVGVSDLIGYSVKEES